MFASLGALSLAGGAVSVLATAQSTDSATLVLARDTFARTVASGFGKADVGGGYSLGYNGANPFSVSPASGGTLEIAPGAVSASLMSVNAADVSVSSVITIGSIPTTTFGLYNSLETRKQGDRSAYRGKVTVWPGGRMTVSVSRKSGAVDTGLGGVAIPARVSPGQQLHLEMTTQGSDQVKLAVRAWVEGSATPGWQYVASDSSSDRITKDGGIGIWDYLCSACKPTTLGISSLTADVIPAESLPTDPTTTPPSETPTSATPTSPTSTPPPESSSPPPAPAPDPGPGPGPTPSPKSDQGSLPVGSASYGFPATARFVSPSGDDGAAGTQQAPWRTLAAAVSKVSAGGTIVLRAGTYHESVLVAGTKVGITIQGYPHEAVWLDGSRVVSNWAQSGSTWVSTGWTAQFDHSASFTTGSNAGGFVSPSYPMAPWPDMVFVDGTQLRQVASAGAVVAGTFFVDYAAKTLRIGTNPGGHEVRASDLSSAVTVAATNVTVRGLGIRRYANALPKGGAIYFARTGDTIENVVVSDTATQGISVYKCNCMVNHVTVVRAGMLGVTGFLTDGVTLQNSVLSQSNSENFNKAPSSAGVKIVQSKNITIRNNLVADGFTTHGIWLDISCIGFTIVGNTVQNNGAAPGIQVELSASGIVANNLVTGTTEGVYVFDSNDVKVFNNTFSQNSTGSVYILQDERRAAAAGYANPACPWIVHNITVSNNMFLTNGGPYGLQFYALDGSTHIAASAMAITINGNLFHTRSATTDSMVGWGGTDGKITHYDTPAALNAGLHTSWSNQEVAPANVVAFRTSANAMAMPLPSDVAAAIGMATGTKYVGAFIK